MKKYDLSILIPARNEMFLSQTVKEILKNKRGNTEIIVGLDGAWANPGVPDHEDVTVVFYPESIGQRAMTNQLCKLSQAKYVMKLDAHCDLDVGFDIKLMADMQDDWTVLPAMRNLWAFDWVCIGTNNKSGKLYLDEYDVVPKGCGHKIYQGPTPDKCPKCNGNMERLLMWVPKESPRSRSFRFDKTMHFQYFNEYMKRPEVQGLDITESMSAQGSCFMLTREKYWELDICDEGHGSWGQQGTEVACKTWLSGGKLMVNNKTWYAHMFRTQGGDFGFPYPISQGDQDKARQYSRHLWLENTWPKAIHNLQWLIDKFAPVPGWHEKGVDLANASETENQATEISVPSKKPTKGVVYYTDNELDPAIMASAQKQLRKGIKEKHVVSVSLKPLAFGKNIVLELERGYLTMARQILAGLEASDAEVIFFCEHDVLYDPSHFDFIPPDKEKIYYNVNVWRVRLTDGHALYTDNLQQLSGLCAYRDTLVKHYKERIKRLEEEWNRLAEYHNLEEFNKFVRHLGFEPGTNDRANWDYKLKAESYKSKNPNLDIRHDKNLTPSRWNKDQFRNQKYTQGWKEDRMHVQLQQILAFK